MTSVYTVTVKELITARLTALIHHEHANAKIRLHDQTLSSKQASALTGLLTSIIRYEGSNNDAQNRDYFIDLIYRVRAEIQPIRITHGKNKDSGQTIIGLNNLALHVSDFYDKMIRLKNEQPGLYKYPLLDIGFKNDPLHQVLLFLMLYHGEEIFESQRLIPSTRLQKEKCVAERVTALVERLQANVDLQTQQHSVAQMFEDLSSDNNRIIKGAPSTIGNLLSHISWLGISCHPQLTREGRLGRLIETFSKRIATLEPAPRLTLPDESAPDELPSLEATAESDESDEAAEPASSPKPM